MGIFERLSTLIRSNINDLVSSAEHPEKMLNQLILDMRTQLVRAKQQVAAAIADEKRLHDQAEAELRHAQDWENRAVLAVREGRDDLARQALARQQEYLTHGQQLHATWVAHRDETEKLKGALRGLNDKIEEAKRKKNLLLARHRRTQAQGKIAETMSGLSDRSALDAFARMEERIDQEERQLNATAEIEDDISGDALAREFTQLERGAGGFSVDTRLLALKQQMGVAPPPPAAAVGAGAPAADPKRQLGAGGGADGGEAAGGGRGDNPPGE
jgi:phage shock protein A